MGSQRVGLIGAGAVVSGFHMPVLAALDSVQVAWITDIDFKRATELARRFGVREVPKSLADASDVDMVLVATPVGARAQVLETVARRRWHAFCEKPFAATAEEHEALLAVMQRAGRRAGVGLVRRFYPSTRTAGEVVRSELLGPVEAVLAGEGIRARKFGRGDWFQSDPRASGGGVFAETGTHLVDQVFSVVGVRGAELEQATQTRVNGLEMETRLSASLTLGNGRTVPLKLAVSRLSDVYNGIVVRCRNGEVRLALDPEAGVELFDKAGARIGTLPGAAKPGIFSAIRAEWIDFFERCGRTDGPDGDTGLDTTRFISQTYERAKVDARTTGDEEAAQ